MCCPICPVVAFPTSAQAHRFRFTATADMRTSADSFAYLTQAIQDSVGDEGAFHISPGDIDPPQQNFDILVETFGSDVVWFPVVGNHEASTASDMEWIRDFYGTLPWIVNQGPSATSTTTYSFDHGNAHFAVINQYYNGDTDDQGDGDVVDALYLWLQEDLAASTQPAKFVLGHEPAFPQIRHVGDSLDQYPENRDRFWGLLEQEGVVAYICGHTHWYSRMQRPGGRVWQIDLGNSGVTHGDLLTFLDIEVDQSSVVFSTWRGLRHTPFELAQQWRVDLPTDRTAPGVAEILVPHDDLSRLEVRFDEQVLSGRFLVSAENRANYRVPGHTVTSARLGPLGQQVSLLMTPPLEVGQNTLVVGNIGDLATPANSLPATRVPFFRAPQWVAIFSEGDSWRYFKGTQDPGDNWYAPEYDDSSWSVGNSGFGYGNQAANTVLDDMMGSYGSVLLRRVFQIEQPEQLGRLLFQVEYDDGFAAYVNGTQVVSHNIPPEANYSALAYDDHQIERPHLLDLSAHMHLLHSGDNVFAIQVHNETVHNSDLLMIPELFYVSKPVQHLPDAGSPDGDNTDRDNTDRDGGPSDRGRPDIHNVGPKSDKGGKIDGCHCSGATSFWGGFLVFFAVYARRLRMF